MLQSLTQPARLFEVHHLVKDLLKGDAWAKLVVEGNHVDVQVIGSGLKLITVLAARVRLLSSCHQPAGHPEGLGDKRNNIDS